MTPIERYLDELRQQRIQPDSAQQMLAHELDRLYHELVADEQGDDWIKSVRSWIWRKNEAPVAGIYVWGGVGRGKTYMMNIFHELLPFKRKLRVHFHHFMHRIHHDLNQLKQQPDPLVIVSERLAEQARVICFDEFHIADIADAMLLGRLLKQLFARRVTLVATSNTDPKDLYKGGLQRDRFLPTIDLLQEYTRVIPIRSEVDYRLRVLEQEPVYYWPLNEAAEQRMNSCYQHIAKAELPRVSSIVIEGRRIAVRRVAEEVGWFEFAALCAGPRSVSDYIEIARRYHTVMISNIPVLGDHSRDQVLRLVHLVDELYDRGVNLIVSADAPVNMLYSGKRVAQPFERTRSRLIEMQTRNYLARKHLPG